jgi:hypothetical protein
LASIDKELALSINKRLTKVGHQAFLDQTMRTGTDWLEEIDLQIEQSDYLIVLLSEESAYSKMVQAELNRLLASVQNIKPQLAAA